MCDTGRVMPRSENPAERVRGRIKRWMETAQLGQRELATDIGKSQVWLQKVLTGENSVRLRDLDAVAHALRTTAAELVRDDADERYTLDLSPTEVRVIEKLRRRPEILDGITKVLQIFPPNGHAGTGNPKPKGV